MKFNTLIYFLFVFCPIVSFGQQIFPELTKKLGGDKDSTVLAKIEKIYNYEVVKKPKNELLLKSWKFMLYDSLGFQTMEDSLAVELLPFVTNINDPIAAKICMSSANKLADKNEFEESIKLMHQGLKIARGFNDLKRICSIQKSIGIEYLHIQDYKTAEKHLKEALYVAKKMKSDANMANCYISLGNAVKEQKDYINAIIYYEKSLALAIKVGDKRLIAGNYNNLGNVMRRQKKESKALEYFQKALAMNKESGNKLWESFNYHNIANLCNDLGKYEQAIHYLKLSNQIKVELGDSLSLVSGYELIREVYANLHDYKNAYEYLDKYIKLKDTLNLKEQADLLKGLEAKYQSEKKQAEIEHLTMSGELQKMKNDSLVMQAGKNRNISILSVLIAISLLIGVGLLWKSNNRRREVNNLLNLKNKEIEDSNLSLNHALNELSVKNKEVIDSINYATYIQQAALPSLSQLSTDLLQFELFFAPKDIVSGDFYFSYQLYKKSVFGVADCTGHGVPGAMVSLVGMNSLDKVVREEKHETSASMVDSLNTHVKSSLQRGGESINDGMDISFCYINHQDNVLHFTGANHTAFILRETTNFETDNEAVSVRVSNVDYSLIELAGTRKPIGKSISEDPFYEVNFQLIKADRIILFSDGFADQTGGDHQKKLKKGTLLSMLLNSAKMPVNEQLTYMKNGFLSWKGQEEQVDDVCLLIAEVL